MFPNCVGRIAEWIQHLSSKTKRMGSSFHSGVHCVRTFSKSSFMNSYSLPLMFWCMVASALWTIEERGQWQIQWYCIVSNSVVLYCIKFRYIVLYQIHLYCLTALYSYKILAASNINICWLLHNHRDALHSTLSDASEICSSRLWPMSGVCITRWSQWTIFNDRGNLKES